MAKLTREQHKVFGSSGASSNFAEFGSLVAGSAVLSKAIATIQSLSAWLNGFQSAIYGANKNLLLEDLNACIYEHSYQVACLLEAGITEWQAATEYSKGSLVQRTSAGDATGEVYQSLVDANIGNAVPVQASNANWRWVNPPLAVKGTALTAGTVPKVGTAPTTGPSGSAALTDSSIIDDGVTVGIALPLKFPDATQQATAASPITTQTDATGVRALGIVYHNTSGKVMFVSAVIHGPTAHTVNAYTDSAATPTTKVAASYIASTGDTTLAFVVLPGNYYKVVEASSTITAWIEWT